MSDKTRGIYKKFNVTRTDGSDGPGCKHQDCDYFVLDLTHDPLSRYAIEAYAGHAARSGYQQLADDLCARLKGMP